VSFSGKIEPHFEAFTEEELEVISERLSNLALAEINKKLKQIVGESF
jgi:hypothetical protein